MVTESLNAVHLNKGPKNLQEVEEDLKEWSEFERKFIFKKFESEKKYMNKN